MKIMDKYFLIVAIIIITLMFPLKIVFWGQEIVSYEETSFKDRIPKFSIQAYIEGEFQDDLEDALFDQLAFSQEFKNFYNTIHEFICIETEEES